MRINTNISSLAAQEANQNTNKNISSSLEKLSTGLRINKASDDASGLAIADKLRTQASSIGQGISNANSASALIQIADKAMGEQSNILDTVKTKLIQAATSTTSEDGREAIRKDITKLLEQFDNIAAQTNYNGTTLLQKDATTTSAQDTLTFQLGEDQTFDASISASKASNTKNLGGGSDTILAAAETRVLNSGAIETNNSALLAGQDSVSLKATGSTIMLTNVSIDGTNGDLTASLASAALDIDLTGNLGKMEASSEGSDIVINADDQSTAVQEKLAIIGTENDAATWDATAKTLTFDNTYSSTALDLSNIEFSDVNVTMAFSAGNLAAGSENTLTIEASTGFSVENNVASGLGKDQLAISQLAAGAADVVGGELLSSISALSAGELTNAKANSYMETIDEAIGQLNSIRSDFGSAQNQINSSLRSMQTTQVNLKAAESVIRDVDYAAESANFNKQNIIAQAGTYAMSQANQVQQNVMRLLQ